MFCNKFHYKTSGGILSLKYVYFFFSHREGIFHNLVVQIDRMLKENMPSQELKLKNFLEKLDENHKK